MNREDWSRSWKPWLRGTFIGFPIGAMPAGGAEIGTFLSYSVEKQLSKKPEEFGNGAIEGVAGPEAANNASAAGTLGSLADTWSADKCDGSHHAGRLSAVRPAAWSAFVCKQSADRLGFDRQPARCQFHVAGSEFAAGRAYGSGCLSIPRHWLYAGILVFATLGTIGANPSTFELGMLLAFGLLGYFLRLFGYPIAPVVVG